MGSMAEGFAIVRRAGRALNAISLNMIAKFQTALDMGRAFRATVCANPAGKVLIAA